MLFFCSGPDSKNCRGPAVKHLKPLTTHSFPAVSPLLFSPVPSGRSIASYILLFPGEFRRYFFILFSRSLLRASFPCVSSSYIADYPHPKKPAKKRGSALFSHRISQHFRRALFSLFPGPAYSNNTPSASDRVLTPCSSIPSGARSPFMLE